MVFLQPQEKIKIFSSVLLSITDSGFVCGIGRSTWHIFFESNLPNLWWHFYTRYSFLALIERFHTPCQQSCKFIWAKGIAFLRKEFNSQRTRLVHQHGCWFMPWRLVLTLYLSDITWWFSSRTKWQGDGISVVLYRTLPPSQKTKMPTINLNKTKLISPRFFFVFFLYIWVVLELFIYYIDESSKTCSRHNVFADLIKSLHRSPGTREWKRGGKGKGSLRNHLVSMPSAIYELFTSQRHKTKKHRLL